MPDATVEDRIARIEGVADRLAAEVAVLRSREGIRDVLYRYCRAVDRLDLELLESCYWHDAHDTHWFFNGPAQQFAEYVVGEVLPDAVMSEHSLTNPLIDLDGERAFVECRWHVLHRLDLRDGEFLDQLIHGRYLDLFERRDGVWKILYRHVVVDAYRDVVVPDIMRDRRPESLGRHGMDDPVYAGFDLERLRPEPHRAASYWTPFLERHGVR